MPSFAPSRNYLLSLTSELIDRHGLSGPFLEIGCGDGAISAALAQRGWRGIALDLSEESVAATRECLSARNLRDRVEVCRADFMACGFEQKFRVVILYDVLEHVREDRAFLAKVHASLADEGCLLLSVPVKMSEWRWDDDGYGHLRRYEDDELSEMLDSPAGGFRKLAQWDFTFPVLWMMRRLYLAAVSPPPEVSAGSLEERTKRSAFVNAGGRSLLVRACEAVPVWPLVYWIQDRFRHRNYGCNTLILARAVPRPE